jgi:DNA modification methylase
MIVHNPNNLPTKPIADLLPTQGDLKDLTEVNYKKLKNVIERRGFSYPVYVWEDKDHILHLLDGHQRQRVLNREGWNEPIPYLKVPAKDLQEAMARLLEITSQYATITQEGIDEFIGKYELNDAEVYEATSFDALAFGKTELDTEVEEDEAPEVSDEPPVSKLGEIYQLGRHRVMCGDTTKDMSTLMNDDTADLVFTDPPYRMEALGGSNDFIGRTQARLGEKIKEMLDFEPQEFLDVLPTAFKKNVLNAYIFCNKDLVPDYLNWANNNGYSFNILFWKKPNAVPLGGTHRPDVEYLILLRKGAIWNNSLKNVSYSRCLEFGRDNTTIHPTMKPIELIANELFISSNKGSIVLDTYSGSGSTLIACEQTDRTCYGMELDPKYVDVIRKRYAKFIYPDTWEERWEELTPAINTGNIQA